MEEFIDNMFNIKNITKAEGIESLQIYLKNQENKKVCFYLEDYFNQSNHIKLFCLEPYLKNNIEKYYQELGNINLDKHNMNNVLLKIIINEKIYIVNIKFNCNKETKKKKSQ